VINNSSNNKTIAKNATMLYLRMFVSMAISFYTSRVVLQALGVSDYGVYNVVGGVVVLMNMITSSLSSATSRFLTYNLGVGNKDLLKKTFSSAFFIHLSFAIIFVLIAETIGLWFVNNHLNIESCRMTAANWVYQSVILSTFIGISQVPYNALISSHEKFSIFAYIDILNSVLKLSVSLIVLYSTYDKLILYSILYAVTAIFIMMIYRLYCIHHFEESKLILIKDKQLLRLMLSFSGWNMYNSASYTMMQQGQNILINRSFGTIINAAAGVASQIQGILYTFIGNITSAFSPQITKEYAKHNYHRVNQLIRMGVNFSALFTLIISIPVAINLNYLLSLWLVEIPQGTNYICQILLISNYINSFNPLTYIAIKASGKIKTVNLICGTMYLLQLPISYFLILLTNNYLFVYLLNTLNPLLTGISYMIILKVQMPQYEIKKFIIKTYIPITFIGFISILLCITVNKCISNSLTSLLITTLLSSLVLCVLAYYIVLSKGYQKKCIDFISAKLKITH